MPKSKHLGQVYTPTWIVKYILDGLGYTGSTILEKHILEPACGDGAFLVEIVKRYIQAAQAEHYSPEKIAEQLGTFIYGVEIDPIAYQHGLARLNQLVQTMLGKSYSIRWQIFQQDTLDFYPQYPAFFDFIVGNPPYIRVHNLPERLRQKIKKQFQFTLGTTDIYLAFFEMAFSMIKPTGKIGFITPNSFLYNASYKKFREFLQGEQIIYRLCDFQSHKVFENFSTYTAITLFDFAQSHSHFDYQELLNNQITTVNQIQVTQLESKRWVLASKENDLFLAKLFENKTHTLADYFTIQYGFATLRDKIFIGQITDIDEQLVEFNGYPVERAILHNIVKGSTFRGTPDEIAWIIFPYYDNNGVYTLYSESILKQQFPLAYQYLLAHKTELLTRDLDKHTPWFGFGRSQGIQNAFNEKMVLPTLAKDEIRFFKLPKDVFVYSGIFITQKAEKADWAILENIFSSPDFLHYIRLTGKDFSGGYKSISTKQLKQFKFSLSENRD